MLRGQLVRHALVDEVAGLILALCVALLNCITWMPASKDIAIYHMTDVHLDGDSDML